MRFILPIAALLTAVSHAAGLDTVIGEFQADHRDLAGSPAMSWSTGLRGREDALLTSWEKRLDTLDYESLDVAGRIDWHLLRASIQERRDLLTLERARFDQTQPLLAFAQPLLQLTDDLARRQLADPEKAAGKLAQALADLKSLRKKLDSSPDGRPTPVVAMRTAESLDEISNKLSNWYSLYDGFQPDFLWWNRQPYEALTADLKSLTEFLRKEVAGQKGGDNDRLIGDPIGPDAVRAALMAEMISYSPEELIAIAEKEFAWCQSEMSTAAIAYGCANRAEALEKVKSHHAPPGEQAATAIAEAEKAIRFLKQNELVTIPPLAEQSWGVAMLGPKQQKSLPYAVYGQPKIMVAYAHEDMSLGDKLESMRGNAYGFLHIVTPHELIPGHHLQGFMARRHAAYRGPFSTPFLVEGWALHWEMVLWDHGYVATPEEKVGALFWRMHRCARIIVSLKFHLGKMTPDEMINFLVDQVGHERSGATAEVRRYIGGGYGPLYQAAYMTGGLQIHALQRELTAPTPGNPNATGTMSLRDFHDRILQQGPIPIEMIRAALKNEALPKSWKPDWRFAG